MSLYNKKHPWPTRKTKDGKYQTKLPNGNWVSRQRAWAVMRALEGQCPTCRKPVDLNYSTVYCRRHAKAHRTQERRRIGAQQWHPGSVGRIPRHVQMRRNQKEGAS